MSRKVEFKNFSPEELLRYYDAYCLKKNIRKNTEEARMLWWVLFYTWKDGGEWIEYE